MKIYFSAFELFRGQISKAFTMEKNLGIHFYSDSQIVQNTYKISRLLKQKKERKKNGQNEGSTQIFNRTVSIKEIGIVQKCLMNGKSKSFGQSWNVNERSEAEDSPND